MEMLFAHLADYVGEDRSGKLIIAGTFDSIFTDQTGPIVLPAFWLVAEFTAHVTEGAEHTGELRLTDADGKDMIPKGKSPLVKGAMPGEYIKTMVQRLRDFGLFPATRKEASDDE